MELLIRDGTYINNKQEERFVENLIGDLEDFIEKHSEDSRASKEVFFLPPLPPRLRYLTHQTVQSVFYDRLTTKSVGEGEDRRTAIFVAEKKPNLASVTPGSKKGQARLSSVAGMKEESKDLKKARKAEVPVYRPPHRRDVPASPTPILASEGKSECKIGESKDAGQKEEEKTTPKSRSKRPDVQVYVPKARRSLDPPSASTGKEEKKPVAEPTPHKPQRRIGVCESPKITSPVKAKQDSDQKLKIEKPEACVTNCRTMEKAESELKTVEVSKITADSPNGKMDEFKSPLKRVASYQLAESAKNSNARGSVFRKSESEPNFKCRDLVSDNKVQFDENPVPDANGSLVSSPLRSPENGGKSPRKVSEKPRISRPRKTSFVPVEEQTSEPVFDKKPTRKPSLVYHGSELEQPSDVWRMEVSELYNGCADLTERHESSGYNSADSDKKDEKTLTLVTDVAEDSVANQVFDSESRDFDSASSKEEDDSWDCIFNDDGEPIKHEVLEELTMAVGKNVTVNKPKIDYLSFVPSIDETQFDEELSHVVEFYDFSSTLKTEDLLIIFGGIRQSGGKSHFDIKWVDDTHALGIYSTPSAAVEALRLIHPLAKARSLAQASRESKLKARKTSEFLQPFKPRPATTASAARRLVTGALGLKSTQSPEQRKAEAQKLRDAKASKKMAAKQREDAWEGNFDSA